MQNIRKVRPGVSRKIAFSQYFPTFHILQQLITGELLPRPKFQLAVYGEGQKAHQKRCFDMRIRLNVSRSCGETRFHNAKVFEDTPKISIWNVYFPDEVGEEIRSLTIYHKEQKLLLGGMSGKIHWRL